MKMFLWGYAERVTDRYHDGGSVLVVAKDLEDARDLWHIHVAAQDSSRADGEPTSASALDGEPDREWVVAEDETVAAEILVFPDAGCC